MCITYIPQQGYDIEVTCTFKKGPFIKVLKNNKIRTSAAEIFLKISTLSLNRNLLVLIKKMYSIVPFINE